MAEQKKSYLVAPTREIHHDGKAYKEGKPINLTDEEAEPLLAVGAVEAVDADGDGKADKTKKGK